MGHEANECFKLYVIPNWYKKYKESQTQNRANYVESSTDVESTPERTMQRENNPDMSKLIQAKIAKCVGQFLHQQPNPTSNKTDANMVQESAKRSSPFEGHFAFSILPSMDTTEWIVDSGANTHICANPKLLYTTHKLDNSTIIFLPDGTSRIVAYARKAKINKDIVLEELLYVPGFTHNLISVAKLIEHLHIKCTFFSTHCTFQKINTDHLVEVGKVKDNLYIMDTVSEKYYISFFNPKDMSVQDWHVFMGHPSVTAMQYMQISKGQMHDEALKAIENCEVCIKSKQARDHLHVLNRRTEGLFDMVHGGIWGLYKQENICNITYVLTLVEDFNRTIWTFPLQSKDQVHEVLATYIQMIIT